MTVTPRGKYPADAEVMLDRCDMFGKENSPEERLQWLVLGALIANPDLRDQVRHEDFSIGFAGAVQELQTAKGRTGWRYLREALQRCGVEWSEGKKPIKRILRRLRLDAETSRVFAYVIDRCADIAYRKSKPDSMKAKFLREMAKVKEHLQVDLSACALVKTEEPEKEKEPDGNKTTSAPRGASANDAEGSSRPGN